MSEGRPAFRRSAATDAADVAAAGITFDAQLDLNVVAITSGLIILGDRGGLQSRNSSR